MSHFLFLKKNNKIIFKYALWIEVFVFNICLCLFIKKLWFFLIKPKIMWIIFIEIWKEKVFKMQNFSGISINKTVKDSLNKWEQLTPLNDLQIKSILSLSQLNQFQINESDEINQVIESSSSTSQVDPSSQRNVMHKVFLS